MERVGCGFSASTEIVRLADVLFSEVGTETVIFDSRRDKYLSLCSIGTRIWQRLEQPIKIEHLCDELALEFDAARGLIEKDVLVFISDMDKAGLIEVISR